MAVFGPTEFRDNPRAIVNAMWAKVSILNVVAGCTAFNVDMPGDREIDFQAHKRMFYMLCKRVSAESNEKSKVGKDNRRAAKRLTASRAAHRAGRPVETVDESGAGKGDGSRIDASFGLRKTTPPVAGAAAIQEETIQRDHGTIHRISQSPVTWLREIRR